MSEKQIDLDAMRALAREFEIFRHDVISASVDGAAGKRLLTMFRKAITEIEQLRKERDALREDAERWRAAVKRGTALTFDIWSSPVQDYTIPASEPPIRFACACAYEMVDIRAMLISGLFENPASATRDWQIEQDDLPEGEPYTIIRDIPVRINKDNEVEYTATFENACLSIGGISPKDAFQALVYEILDALDYMIAHRSELGPEPLRQLGILSQHIVKSNR